jgi:hypothetical protein
MAVYAGPDIVENGLVLHLDAANPRSYPGTGTGWFDLSGLGNNGTLINGVSYNTSNNGIFTFDNTDDYVSLPNDLGYTTSFSAFAWFRRIGDAVNGFHLIFGGQELEISITNAGALRTGIFTTSRFVSNHGSGVTDGNWHNIGFIFDGSNKDSYIEGRRRNAENRYVKIIFLLLEYIAIANKAIIG